MTLPPTGATLSDRDSDREIIISRTFDAPRSLVFRVWSDARHVTRWWGPNGFTAEECRVDFRVGGEFRLQLRGPDGRSYPCAAIYREIVEPERIVFASTVDDGPGCGAGLPPRSVVTVTFEEHAGRTRLTIHTRLASVDDRAAAIESGFLPGWTQCLERLADNLVAE